MMRFKNMLKIFSKTEVQEEKTHPNPPLEREGVNVSCAKHTEKNLFSYLPIHLFTFKKVAFTLAEVLITLGIVGVISALTMPSLINNYREHLTVVKLNSMYSLLSQGFERMVEEHGEINSYADNSYDRVAVIFERFPKYIQTTKNCGHNQSGCINNGAPFSYRNYAFALKNGTSIRLIDGGTCVQDTTMTQTGGWELNDEIKGSFYGTYHHACAFMYINIDGKKPVVLGKNTFLFAVVKNGIVPVGGPKENTSYNNISKCLNGSDLSRCTAWVIYNKNMDYLHCPDKLGWDKSTSCKD